MPEQFALFKLNYNIKGLIHTASPTLKRVEIQKCPDTEINLTPLHYAKLQCSSTSVAWKKQILTKHGSRKKHIDHD